MRLRTEYNHNDFFAPGDTFLVTELYIKDTSKTSLRRKMYSWRTNIFVMTKFWWNIVARE